jgi:hypothetical protein
MDAARKIEIEQTATAHLNDAVVIAPPTITPWSRRALMFSAYAALNWLYDFPLYAWAIWFWGPLIGGLSMAALSVPVDLVTYRFYNHVADDWLGIEYLRTIRSYDGASKVKRCIRWIMNFGPRWLQTVVLSLRFNSFLVTTLLRSGDAGEFRPWTRGDWKTFWLSYATAQIYWIGCISIGVWAGSALFEMV